MIRRLTLAFAALLSSVAMQAQDVDINSLLLNSTNPTECMSLSFTANMTHSGANYTYAGVTSTVTAGTLYISINYTSTGIVLPAIVMVNQTFTITPVGQSGNVPVIVTGYLNGTPSTNGTLTTSITLGSCCPVDASIALSDSLICDGDQITVTNTSANSTSSDLYLNGINIGSGTSAQANISGAGPYVFKVVASDGTCSDSTQFTIQSLTTDLGASDTVCSNATRTLDAGDDWPNYAWSTGATTQTIQVNTTGTYAVTASTGNGCVITDNVFLEYPDIPNLGNDTTICIDNSPYTLDAGSNWDFVVWDNGSTSNQLSVGQSGTYNVTVYDVGLTCQKTDQVNVTFIGENFDVLDEFLCPGDSATYSLSGWDNYFWSNNETDSSITISQPGTYTVTVTHLNSACTLIDTFNVDNSSQFFSLADTALCQTESFIASIGNGYSNILWSTGSITSSILVNSPGTYYVTATNADGCVSSDTMVVSEMDSIMFTLGSDTTLCIGESLELGVALNDIDNWMWSTGSGDSSITVMQSGTYHLNVESNGGCVGYDEIEVEFIECSNSIEELGADAIRVYPNPASSAIQLYSGVTLNNAKVVMYNGLGQIVLERTLSQSNITIDVSNLPTGSYIIQVESSEGIWQHKLLIQ